MRISAIAIFLFTLFSACGLKDGTSDNCETAVITIDTKEQGTIISPNLFGHNLEHTRRAIWKGISAQMLANRKFSAVDGGLPKHWWTLNGKGVSVDEKVAFTGEYSILLEKSDGTSCGMWQQQDWLAFRKGTKYTFRIWTKSVSNQNIQLQIVGRDGFSNIFTGATLVRSGEWQLWTGEFEAPLSTKGARFEIRIETPGPVWIGAVSLMQSDNFHGMRRDVVELMKSLKPGNLRWPGGCFAEYYAWEDGLLPVDQRPALGPHQWLGLLPDSDGYDNHEIGIDEYIALCRELNCEPVITIRYGGGGTPEEAAAWVEYCNGSKDTHWGRVRTERGYSGPYQVKYWYVGNEIWGMSLVENKDPGACAILSQQFAGAMKKVDPSIQLVGCAPSHNSSVMKEWFPPLLKEAGNFLEMVQNGFYFENREAITMAKTAKAPTKEVLDLLRSVRQFTDSISPDEEHYGIAFYEWNTYWDRGGDGISGIFAAGVLNMLMREQEALDLRIAGYFQPITEGAIKVDPFTCKLEPDGQVFVMYSAHQGNRLLKLPAMDPDADIDLCASLSPDGKSIFATVINRNTQSKRTLELSLGKFKPANASMQLLIPSTLEVGGEVRKQEEKIPLIAGNRLMLTLPPCSIAGLYITQ